jgi:multidrug resistance efflux pump
MEPDVAQDVLVELGLAEPAVEGYVVTGMLESRKTNLATINGGRVLEFEFEVGERVEEGDTLVSLDGSLLEPKLLVAQARLEAIQAQLDLLQAPPREVDLVLAKAAISHAHALYEGANQALEDIRDIAPEAVREDQIEIAQAQVNQAQAGLELARANLDILEDGASESQIARLEAALDAAQAEVARQQSVLDDQIIRAPSGGVILNQFLLPSEVALPGQTILSISNLETLELNVFLPEADLGWAKLGEEVQFSVDAMQDRVFTGEIIYIANQAEFTPRNVQTPEDRVILVFEVRILVGNSDGALKPGLPAEVTLGGTS